jgi:hypothetical protein
VRYRFCGRFLLLAFLVAGFLWLRAPASGKSTRGDAAPPQTEVKYFGTASCASMACHHFNGPEGSERSEYSTWANGDKHSRAYTVLYDERSERIIKNLRGPKAPPATEDKLCLKCHATNDGNLHDAAEQFVRADGVGCEACHGPAQKYLTEHYLAGFKEKASEEKERVYGLKNTKSLVKRAELCITCHVGDSTKEVNHDLIAAGHPRLNFELAGYHGIYHKHWSHDSEVKRHPDFEARLWLIGQLVSAKAAVDLLAVRADSAEKPLDAGGRPWPEFAEYACYACHKDIKVDSPAQKSDYYKNRHPGSFPYGTWYLSSLPQLTGDPGYVPGRLLTDLKKLQGSMERPGPSAKDVAAQAKDASGLLSDALGRLERGRALDAARLTTLLKRSLDDGQKRANELSWDEAAQLYLSIAALTQGLNEMGAPTLTPGKGREQLLQVKNRLRNAFPKTGYDSPKDYDPLAKPSLADQLKLLRLQLGN